MDGPMWMVDGIAVFAVSSGQTTGQTNGLVWTVPKNGSLESEAQASSRSLRPSFPILVSCHHLADATFASLEDPF